MRRKTSIAVPQRRRLRAVVLACLGSLLLYFAFQPQDLYRIGGYGAELLGFDDAALRLLQRIESPAPNVQLKMARLAFEIGDYERSSRLYLTVGPDSEQDIASLGICFSKEGRWMEAVPVLEQAQKAGADDPQMLMELADSYAYLGLYEKSLATLGMLEKRGLVSAALYRRGLILREKGDFPGFISEWTTLVNRPVTQDVENLNWEQVRLELAEACVARGMFAEAQENLSSLVPDARSEFIQGKACYGLGNRNAAIDHWNRSVELQPTTTAPRFELAKVYFAEGKSDEAKKILGPVTKEVETASADICNLMQMISVQQKDDESAALWKTRREQAETRSEKLGKLIRLSTQFDTITGKIIRAWKFAGSGHHSQALTLLQPLLEEIKKSGLNSKGATFVRKLDRSIREGSELPDLVELVDIEDAASQGQSQ